MYKFDDIDMQWLLSAKRIDYVGAQDDVAWQFYLSMFHSIRVRHDFIVIIIVV